VIIWNDEALLRSGLSVEQAEDIVAFAASEREYEADAARLRARRQQAATVALTARHQPAPARVFPAGVHIDRYAELARSMGY
jgi:hypothetical protein